MTGSFLRCMVRNERARRALKEWVGWVSRDGRSLSAHAGEPGKLHGHDERGWTSRIYAPRSRDSVSPLASADGHRTERPLSPARSDSGPADQMRCRPLRGRNLSYPMLPAGFGPRLHACATSWLANNQQHGGLTPTSMRTPLRSLRFVRRLALSRAHGERMPPPSSHCLKHELQKRFQDHEILYNPRSAVPSVRWPPVSSKKNGVPARRGTATDISGGARARYWFCACGRAI